MIFLITSFLLPLLLQPVVFVDISFKPLTIAFNSITTKSSFLLLLLFLLLQPVVYVDGSSVSSRCGVRVGGAGVFWGLDDPRNVFLPLKFVVDDLGRRTEVTNNRAELVAAIVAVQNVNRLSSERTLTDILTDFRQEGRQWIRWIEGW